MRVHHTALCPSDLERSLVFYRDGIGLQVLADLKLTGSLGELFGLEAAPERALMLGDPERNEAGILELVVWDGELGQAPAASSVPPAGFFLICFYVDVDATAERLTSLGYEPNVFSHESAHGAIRMGTVRDPDGVLVELVQFVRGAPSGYSSDGA